jgi:hypothetical protein
VRLKILLEPLLGPFLQQRRKDVCALEHARLQQTAAGNAQIAARAQRLAERHAATRRRHGFIAGCAEPGQDRIDQRVGISRPDTQGIARAVRDRGALQRDDVMVRVFRRTRRRQPMAADPDRRDGLLLAVAGGARFDHGRRHRSITHEARAPLSPVDSQRPRPRSSSTMV